MLRGNAEWVADLSSDERRSEALADLRKYLLRAVFVYLERHRPDLAHLERRDLEHLAEDFTQDALLRILDRLDTFRGESKFTTWAYRFVINIAASELRLHRWRTISIESLTVDQAEVSLLAFLSDEAVPDPETAAARSQIVALVQRVIEEELTERQRLALVGVHFRGVPVTEVARLLDTTPNSVYKLVYDARRKLKAALQRHHYSERDVLAIFGGT
jgi:RNA polymerase sigma-70 factor (ECF subfamily)